jgi:hypothetical protein
MARSAAGPDSPPGARAGAGTSAGGPAVVGRGDGRGVRAGVTGRAGAIGATPSEAAARGSGAGDATTAAGASPPPNVIR